MIAFQYKLYSNAKRGALDAQIDAFGELQNYIIRFCRRYYKLCKKPVDSNALSRHITKVKRTAHKWIADLPSQAVQDVIQRVFKAFKLFGVARKAKRKASLPHTKKPNSHKSFTLKQCGYGINGNKVRIGKHIYGFHVSRHIQGKIKTLTVKRDATGDLWIIVVTDYVRPKMTTAKSGKSVGCDFGMKTFLTLSDETKIEAPLFLKQAAKRHKKVSRLVSSKKRKSKNRTKAKQTKARVERHIANQRSDFQWKLARRLLAEYDVLCFEDLNLQAMSRRFGRKIQEYGLYGFLQKLKYLATIYDKKAVQVSRWFPSSKLCHNCGYKNDNLQLKDRSWICPSCGLELDRDLNASINIKREGTSSLGSTCKTA